MPIVLGNVNKKIVVNVRFRLQKCRKGPKILSGSDAVRCQDFCRFSFCSVPFCMLIFASENSECAICFLPFSVSVIHCAPRIPAFAMPPSGPDMFKWCGWSRLEGAFERRNLPATCPEKRTTCAKKSNNILKFWHKKLYISLLICNFVMISCHGYRIDSFGRWFAPRSGRKTISETLR